jgi:hypothetical protein
MPRSIGLKDKSSEKNNGAVMKALKVKKPKKGRAKGAKNYDKEKLLSAVKAVMPVKMRDWDEVLLVYQTTAKEKVEGRTAEKVKRYFYEKMCNGLKKPTGNSGGKYDICRDSQEIWLQLGEKEQVGVPISKFG